MNENVFYIFTVHKNVLNYFGFVFVKATSIPVRFLE